MGHAEESTNAPGAELSPPRLVVLAGPNGAGKATAAPVLLAETLGIREFVNADVIARGLSGFQPERAAIQAGRIMLTACGNWPFSVQVSPLKPRSPAGSMLPGLRSCVEQATHSILCSSGFPVRTWLSAACRSAFAWGGIRYPKRPSGGATGPVCVTFGLYRPLADEGRFYDNVNPAGPRLVASGNLDQTTVEDVSAWQQVQQDWNYERPTLQTD